MSSERHQEREPSVGTGPTSKGLCNPGQSAAAQVWGRMRPPAILFHGRTLERTGGGRTGPLPRCSRDAGWAWAQHNRQAQGRRGPWT